MASTTFLSSYAVATLADAERLAERLADKEESRKLGTNKHTNGSDAESVSTQSVLSTDKGASSSAASSSGNERGGAVYSGRTSTSMRKNTSAAAPTVTSSQLQQMTNKGPNSRATPGTSTGTSIVQRGTGPPAGQQTGVENKTTTSESEKTSNEVVENSSDVGGTNPNEDESNKPRISMTGLPVQQIERALEHRAALLASMHAGIDHDDESQYEHGAAEERPATGWEFKRLSEYRAGEIETEFVNRVIDGDLLWVLDCCERVGGKPIIWSKWGGKCTRMCLLYALKNRDELMTRLLLHFGGNDLLHVCDFKRRNAYHFAEKMDLDMVALLKGIEGARVDCWRQVKRSEAFRIRAQL